MITVATVLIRSVAFTNQLHQRRPVAGGVGFGCEQISTTSQKGTEKGEEKGQPCSLCCVVIFSAGSLFCDRPLSAARGRFLIL